MHVENITLEGRAFDDARGAGLADGLVDDEEVGELAGARDSAEEFTEDGAVFDGHGRSLGQVRERSVARVAQEGKVPVWMAPDFHFLAVLETPFARLLDEVEERSELGVPFREELSHLLDVGFGHVDHFGEVIGTGEDDVVEPAAFEEVADCVGVWAHPVIYCGLCGQFLEERVLLHVFCFDDDSVGKISG